MTQSVRVRRFLALILVVAVVAIGVGGCAKRAAVSPGLPTRRGIRQGQFARDHRDGVLGSTLNHDG